MAKRYEITTLEWDRIKDYLPLNTPKQTVLEPLKPNLQKILSHMQFRKFFTWLSASVSCVSAPLPGEEPKPDDWQQFAEPCPRKKL